MSSSIRHGYETQERMREAEEPKFELADDKGVRLFSEAMRDKLAQKRGEGRGGWDNKDECSAEYLSELLRKHVEKGDPVDVANFCMMLHQRGERILSPIQPTPSQE